MIIKNMPQNTGNYLYLAITLCNQQIDCKKNELREEAYLSRRELNLCLQKFSISRKWQYLFSFLKQRATAQCSNANVDGPMDGFIKQLQIFIINIPHKNNLQTTAQSYAYLHINDTTYNGSHQGKYLQNSSLTSYFQVTVHSKTT